MRLDKIKLAGFKSFVDPTVIPLPGNLVGIVGPNGCGKSNIIDAVRWVLGESSAKHLRGESMADVIFNGSSARKPVGVATVELAFDNADGAIGGEYARYREISLKRQVTRDGQSAYFLNDRRCRRKDIADLFLGTGLGARGYAIIEQGSIARLIEAKPDELRAVIEEAAGVSKYKERRAETETRMKHTQENLERLDDVREELARQLANLQRQAKKAEKYVALKAEERRLRLQLLGVRRRHYEHLLAGYREALQASERQFRELVAADNEMARDQETERARHETLRSELHDSQARFYELGSEIGRLDQSIKHAAKTREELSRERARIERELAQAQERLEQDSEELEAAREEMTSLEAQKSAAEEGERRAAAGRAETERALRAWREEWELAANSLAQGRTQVELRKARARQLDEQRRQLQARRERLSRERDEIEDARDDDEMESLRESLAPLEIEQARLRARLEDLPRLAREARALAKSSQESLNAARARLHTLQGRISSLELLQRHAMGKDRAASQDWLRGLELADAGRLAEHLEVHPDWETAVENVLGMHLEAVCVEDAGPILPRLNGDAGPGSLAVFETGGMPAHAESARRNPLPSAESLARAAAPESSVPRLLDCVNSPWSLEPLLGAVYRAGDLASAHNLRGGLARHESVVTPCGAWMGPGWLLLKRADDGRAGVLKRERELRETLREREDARHAAETLEGELSRAEETARAADFERERRQSEANGLSAEIAELTSRLVAAAARDEQARKRLGQLELELEDLEDGLSQNAEEVAEAMESLESAQEKLAEGERENARLAGSRREAEQRAAEAETALREARDRSHGLKSRLEALKSSATLTLKHLDQLRAQCRQMDERREELERRQEEADAPLDDERLALEELLHNRSVVERELAGLRKQAGETEARLRGLEENRMRKARELDALKQRLEQIRLDYQGAEAREQALDEQFEELGVQPEAVLADLPEEAEEKAWQKRVNELAEEIAKLGSVNLTAMEEFEEQSERQRVLDAQRQDLSESLATLRQAIEKIDRECRTRFKDTFERVNDGVQRMFPKLFGGGQAYLNLDERDLLESGVSIMARPPGKRNSSIHLLSGGEKALTAVALVFAIFELNPAPFCLLDEVDAPLDDANVGRFGELVKEMSERVQFLFISHNKVTMEIAQHLTGVTMKEPGVSRIVAVDIDAAVELSAQ
jgi:chromosome segregation protein